MRLQITSYVPLYSRKGATGTVKCERKNDQIIVRAGTWCATSEDKSDEHVAVLSGLKILKRSFCLYPC